MFCSLHTPTNHNSMFSDLQSVSYHIDAAISKPGHALLKQRYLVEGETASDRFIHACVAYADDINHALRLSKYIMNGWFMFATPVLANAGTARGLPISCYLNYVDDSRVGLADHYKENIFLSTNGGGIGGYWSAVRSVGSQTSGGSESTGVIPFMKVADSITVGFRQGKTRQGAYAAYLSVRHPEIMEFLDIRTSTGGDLNRRSLNIHHGVCIPDEFMEAVLSNDLWDLVDPHTGDVSETVSARNIWGAILRKRFADRGEPYLFFEDAANQASNYHHSSGKYIHGSNLCTEIMLATSADETAVCCLSSVNAHKFDEWKNDGLFIADLIRMLDNVLTVFIEQAPPEMERAIKSAVNERSIGLGCMGVHSYLQENGLLYGGDEEIFKYIHARTFRASRALAEERGPADAAAHRYCRNTHLTAVAPNASSSIMLGVSPSIEPWRSNVFTVYQGSLMFEVKNPVLDRIIQNICTAEDTILGLYSYEELWNEVRADGGSVQNVVWLSDNQKKNLRTFAEIDQWELVEAASLRQVWICQGQSLNLCFNSDASPKYINDVHIAAWKGVEGGAPLKSLYYCRTNVAEKIENITTPEPTPEDVGATCSITNKDECLACQG